MINYIFKNHKIALVIWALMMSAIALLGISQGDASELHLMIAFFSIPWLLWFRYKYKNSFEYSEEAKKRKAARGYSNYIFQNHKIALGIWALFLFISIQVHFNDDRSTVASFVIVSSILSIPWLLWFKSKFKDSDEHKEKVGRLKIKAKSKRDEIFQAKVKSLVTIIPIDASSKYNPELSNMVIKTLGINLSASQLVESINQVSNKEET
jgi:hypothetical protein